MSKKKGGKLKWVVLAVIAAGVIGAVGGNSDSNTTSSSNASAKTESAKTESAKEVDAPAPIEYTSVSVNDMMSQLDDNALGASDKYKGQYLEITGRLGNIDSSGKYISLYPDDEYAIIGVQCQIKNDEQRSKVASMAKGDTVTLKGKCTTVGEVLGYSVDIEEIE